MIDKGFAFLAAAARAGKTTVAIGFARHLSNRGVNVIPFKAVSVVCEADDVAFRGVHPTRWGLMHNVAAARAQFDLWQNPVTVILDRGDAKAGELITLGRSRGRVRVAGKDCVDVAQMSPFQARACNDAVCSALEAARSEDGVLLAEGAGGVGALAPAHDLSNVVAPRALSAAVVFVCDVNACHPPEVVERIAHWCRAESLDVRGLVFNQVAGGPLPSRPRGLELLACVAATPDLDDYDGSSTQLEFLYERAARAIARSGLTQRLLGSRP